MLAIEALIIQGVFGIAFGLVAGLCKGGFFDSTVLVLSLVVIAVPTFVLGFALQLLIGVQLGWAKPTVGSNVTWGSLILPAVVLGLVSFAYVLRLTRASVIENMNADYVRTATAKGLARRQVVTTHVLRNSLIPDHVPRRSVWAPDGGARRDGSHLQCPRCWPEALPGHSPK